MGWVVPRETDVLGRKDGADAQGLAGYQGQLASGAITMAQVRNDLANSREVVGQIVALTCAEPWARPEAARCLAH